MTLNVMEDRTMYSLATCGTNLQNSFIDLLCNVLISGWTVLTIICTLIYIFALVVYIVFLLPLIEKHNIRNAIFLLSYRLKRIGGVVEKIDKNAAHYALVAHGLEYSQNPDGVKIWQVGLGPLEPRYVKVIGFTQKTKEDLDRTVDFLKENAMEKYHVIDKNCIDFCNYLSEFLLGHGIPKENRNVIDRLHYKTAIGLATLTYFVPLTFPLLMLQVCYVQNKLKERFNFERKWIKFCSMF